jgi:hypothetical protein
MEAMRAQFECESSLDGPWTSYNASLGRPLLNTEKFLAPKKQAAPEDALARNGNSSPSAAEPSDSPEPIPTLSDIEPRR